MFERAAVSHVKNCEAAASFFHFLFKTNTDAHTAAGRDDGLYRQGKELYQSWHS